MRARGEFAHQYAWIVRVRVLCPGYNGGWVTHVTEIDLSKNSFTIDTQLSFRKKYSVLTGANHEAISTPLDVRAYMWQVGSGGGILS